MLEINDSDYLLEEIFSQYDNENGKIEFNSMQM